MQTYVNGLTGMIQGMAKGFTTPGPLPALEENKLGRYWAESGKSGFLFACLMLSKYLSIGCDRVIMTRIHHMLKSDDQFRQQTEGLIMDESVTIELDKGMSYSSFATFLHLFKVNAKLRSGLPKCQGDSYGPCFTLLDT